MARTLCAVTRSITRTLLQIATCSQNIVDCDDKDAAAENTQKRRAPTKAKWFQRFKDTFKGQKRQKPEDELAILRRQVDDAGL